MVPYYPVYFISYIIIAYVIYFFYCESVRFLMKKDFISLKRDQINYLFSGQGQVNFFCILNDNYFPKNFILGDSRSYMPPILAPSSAKSIATQILVIANLNERKDFILRVFVCDIIRPSKESPVQS